MTWAARHAESESLAAKAEVKARAGDLAGAEGCYREAAVAEARALEFVGPDKIRTYSITAVSAVALYYKAHDYAAAQQLAYFTLGEGRVAAFARQQLEQLLQMCWSSREAERAGIKFVAGDLLVSVKGGSVVHGGAPLDLVLKKVEEVSALFFRTAEMLFARPLRRRGGPPQDIQAVFQPWLFSAPAGSYQFAIRVREPAQSELFPDARPRVEEVTRTVLAILSASATDPARQLPVVVPDKDYQGAFLRLTRNLAPTGKSFEQIDLRDAAIPTAPTVSFVAASREEINAAIRQSRPPTDVAAASDVVELRGVLRALHLDQDWLEVSLEDNAGAARIEAIGDVLDDVVGPMVNNRVVVKAARKRNRYRYIDIEAAD